jgi:hypothetical protein
MAAGSFTQQYRLLDLERLCWRLETANLQGLRNNPEAALADAIAQGELKRESSWTASLAVGSGGFGERIKPLMLSRRETEILPTENGTWIPREPAAPYGPKTGPKSAANDDYGCLKLRIHFTPKRLLL